MTGRYLTDRPAAALATTAWLNARGLRPPPALRWEVMIALDVVDRPALPTFDGTTDTRFHISISAGEWGFFFCHAGRVSWIRVTDLPSIYERDEHELLRDVPPLRDVGTLVHRLEERHKIAFHRKHCSIRTTLPGAEDTIRLWVAASI